MHTFTLNSNPRSVTCSHCSGRFRLATGDEAHVFDTTDAEPAGTLANGARVVHASYSVVDVDFSLDV